MANIPYLLENPGILEIALAAISLLLGLALAATIWRRYGHDITNLRIERNRIKGEIQKLQADATNQRETQHTMLRESETRSRELEEMVAQRETTLRMKENEVRNLSSMKQSLEDTLALATGKSREIQALEERFVLFEQKASGRHQGLENLTDELTARRTELAKKNAEITLLNKSLDSLRANAKGSEKRIADLRYQLESQTNKVNAYQKQVGELTTSIQETEGTIASLNTVQGDENLSYHHELGLIYRNAPKHADDLNEIHGLGHILIRRLNKLGVYRWKQIGLWNQQQSAHYAKRLAIRDRIDWEGWVLQSQMLHNQYYEDAFFDLPADYKKDKLTANLTDENVRDEPGIGTIYDGEPAIVDKLARIFGIDEVVQRELYQLGIYRFKQIGLWTPSVIREVSRRLKLGNRIIEDDWMPQGRRLHNREYQDGFFRADHLDVDSLVATDFAGDDVRIDARRGITYRHRPEIIDDLSTLRGLPTTASDKLNEAGIFRFKQITVWNDMAIRSFAHLLGIDEDFIREQWIPEATKKHRLKYESEIFNNPFDQVS